MYLSENDQNWHFLVTFVNVLWIISAQWVPEPDPLPGISFDTRPNPIQFWKSSGSG